MDARKKKERREERREGRAKIVLERKDKVERRPAEKEDTEEKDRDGPLAKQAERATRNMEDDARHSRTKVEFSTLRHLVVHFFK